MCKLLDTIARSRTTGLTGFISRTAQPQRALAKDSGRSGKTQRYVEHPLLHRTLARSQVYLARGRGIAIVMYAWDGAGVREWRDSAALTRSSAAFNMWFLPLAAQSYAKESLKLLERLACQMLVC